MSTESNLTYYQRNKEKMKVNTNNYYHNKNILKQKKRDNYTQEKKNK